MSRNRHKSYHEKEKCKKKCRVHRTKYEKGRNEREIAETNVRKSVWSRWLNFIRGHWCGRMKSETNPLDIYTRALSADVFDIPVEPKSTVTRTKMTIPEYFADGLALSKVDSHCASKKNENPHKKEEGERLTQCLGDHQEAAGGQNLPTSGVYFSENADRAIQDTNFAFPRLWSQNGHSKNLDEPSRSILEKTTSRRKDRIPEHSEVQYISRRSSEPTWNEKEEIYHRQQVKAGIDNLLDQLMCIQQDCYRTKHKELKEKKRIEFNVESSLVRQKISRQVSPKISRQVSPAILVNIKPFKRQITQSELQENFSMATATNKFKLNQIKKTKRLEEKVESQLERIGKESENFQFRCPALKNQVITVRNFWDSQKEKPVSRKDTIEHQNAENRVVEGSLNKDFCFVVGVYRSYDEVNGESDRKSLDEVLENLDGRDHNVVFKKNMRQFRKKIISGSIKGEEKETGRREPKFEKGVEALMKTEKLGVESILAILMKSEIVLGIHYDIVTEYNIVRTVFFVREEIFIITISQIVREIYQCHEICFNTIIQKRFSNVTTLLIREMREIRVGELKTARILHELKYCLRNVKGVARVMFSPKRKTSNIFFITSECSTLKQLAPLEPQENITDFLGLLQEYSKLVEESCRFASRAMKLLEQSVEARYFFSNSHRFKIFRSETSYQNYIKINLFLGCSNDDLIEIDKILSTVAKSFIEAERGSDGASVNINVIVENLTKAHKVVQILNNSALEYLALIYQTLDPRNCSGKSFSETDLHKRRKQAITLSYEVSEMKDFFRKELRQRSISPTSSADASQILYNDLESLSDEDETLGHYESGTEHILDDKRKGNSSIASFSGKKMLMFKSNSFPGEISTSRDYRAQRSRLFKDLHKEAEKKIKSTEEGLDINKGGISDCLAPEKPIKIESDSAKFQKYLVPDELKNVNENGNKKMFFIEQNAGKLRKEVIAAFSTIKDLSEEKDSAKTSVVIMLSRK